MIYHPLTGKKVGTLNAAEIRHLNKVLTNPQRYPTLRRYFQKKIARMQREMAKEEVKGER